MAPEVQRVRSGLLADWLSAAWKPPLLVIGCLVLSTLILPRWLNYGGSLFGRPLTVEASIRWYLGLTMALGLCVSALIRWPHWSHGMRQTWWALVALLVSFIPIFLFDETRLWDEESWTRYPTTITLIAAGLASLYLVKLRRLSAMPVGETMFWLLLTCCFIFLGADEYLGLHESFGDWLERMPTFAFIDQDWITLAYLILGALSLFVYWVFLRRHISVGQHLQLSGYITGVAVFGVSQVFDSLDKTIRSGLSGLATRLAAQGHGFPDVWFVLYRPRQFLNSAEEVLECVAAVVLLVSTVSLVVEESSGRRTDRGTSPSRPLFPGSGLRLGRWMLTAAVVVFLGLGWPAATSSSPFVDRGRLVKTQLGSKRQSSNFRRKAVLPDGSSLALIARRRELVRHSAEGRELGRSRVRLMLRDLRGVRMEGDGGLSLLTKRGRGSFMPPLVWKTGAAAELSPPGERPGTNSR